MNKMLITTAGLAEIVNAEQSGTAPVVLSHVAFGTGQYTATADMTKLKSEFKRFDAVAGGAISDNMIHLTIHDNSTDKYTVNEVGVFTAGGTLFAVISQTTPIIEKSATSESMLAIDIALTDIDPDSISFGDTNIVLNPATTETAGVVELATDAEAKSGTDTTRAITPAAAKAARDADANIVHRTGNETIAGQKTYVNTNIYKADVNFKSNVATDLTTESAEDQLWYGDRFVDNNGVQGGAVQYFRKSNGDAEINLQVKSKSSNGFSSLALTQTKDGSAYATAPTPPAGDNSTKIATTQWANAKFLPLAGGTMSGTISKAGGTFLNNTNSSSSLVLTGDKLSHNASVLMLFGLEHSDYPGGFIVRSGNNNVSYTLLGKADGSLIWGGKNIVRSVNGKNADAAGNANITAADVDALPTSGGAMTATKAITRDVNNSYLGLHGGTGTDNDGAQLDLCGSEHPSMPGTFQLHARTPDKDVILRGMTDGKLTWGDKYVLTNSYVATVDNGAVMLTAGTQSVKGAYLRLYGADHSTGAGTFAIAASDGTTSKSLTGNADGTLTWGGVDVMAAKSMPSQTYVDLTEPASSESYKAPADGWVVYQRRSDAAGQYIQLAAGTVNGDTGVANSICRSTAGSQQLAVTVPVQKGWWFFVRRTAKGDLDIFRFVYAEGAKHLATE